MSGGIIGLHYVRKETIPASKLKDGNINCAKSNVKLTTQKSMSQYGVLNMLVTVEL